MEKLSWFLLPVAAVIIAMIVIVAITQLSDARSEVSVDTHVNAQSPESSPVKSPCVSYLCQEGKAKLQVCTSGSGVHTLQWSFRSGDEFVGTEPYQERQDYDIEKYINDNLCNEE